MTTASVPPTAGAIEGLRPEFARRTALVAGVFYLITIVASIPAVILLGPVLNDSRYVVGAGADSRVLWGCLLDVVNALACIGTAVTLFPVVKRQNEATALGFVAARVLEAAIILIGVVSLLALVNLRQDVGGTAGANAGSLVIAGQSLVRVRNGTFLLGPGLMPGINALLLGSLMYTSRLVPRIIPTVGLIGAPLLIAGAVATFLGYTDQVSVWSAIGTLPVAAWELSLALWMVVKGFQASSPLITPPSDADYAPRPSPSVA
jgi:hypothetical protein